VVRSRRGKESPARACYRVITCKRHPRGMTTCARCARDGNSDDTTGFGHGGAVSIPCGNFWFPLPFLIEKGIVFVTFHRERTIGRPSPKYLVVVDAACAAISSHVLPAGSNSRARPRHSRSTSLATSKSKAPERSPNVQSTPAAEASRIGVPNRRCVSAMRREF
jgi:hypothetical protein